jgi:hypothetical protein
MTFGGMGSKKLIGENIEYIANYDSHPGAQFNSEFRSLVKSEIAKFSSDGRLEAAKAVAPQPNKLAKLPQSARPKPTEEQLTNRRTAKDHIQIAQTETPTGPKRTTPEQVAQEPPKQQQREGTGFLDRLSSSVNSGNLFVQRQLTISDMKDYAHRRLTIADMTDYAQRRLRFADMKDYAERSFRGSHTAELTTATSD